MHFTIQQAKLYYHLLKGERLYRTWKQRGGAEAGLNVLAESVLARYSWERQKSFVARSGLKGSALIPDPRPLEERAGELTGLVYRDAASASGLNPWGYSVDPLIQHLEEGLSGFIVAGPSGSKAVLWKDLMRSKPLSARGQVLLNRLANLFVSLFVLFWGIWYTLPGPTYFYLNITATIFLAGAFAAVIGGLYWKWANSLGAYCAMIAGALGAVGFFFFDVPTSYADLGLLFSPAPEWRQDRSWVERKTLPYHRLEGNRF